MERSRLCLSSCAVRVFSLQLMRVGLVAPRHVGSQFPDQGSNLCPLHWKADSLPLDRQGSPWVDILFFFFKFLNFILFIFYTAGPYQLAILYILVYICQSQSPWVGILYFTLYQSSSQRLRLPNLTWTAEQFGYTLQNQIAWLHILALPLTSLDKLFNFSRPQFQQL